MWRRGLWRRFVLTGGPAGDHSGSPRLQRDYLSGSIPLIWWGYRYPLRTWLGVWGRQNSIYKWFINLRGLETHLRIPQNNLKIPVSEFLGQPSENIQNWSGARGICTLTSRAVLTLWSMDSDQVIVWTGSFWESKWAILKTAPGIGVNKDYSREIQL